MSDKVCVTLFVSPRQMEALQALKEVRRIPLSEFIRQAVDAVLEKNKDALEGVQKEQVFEVWVHPTNGYAMLLSTSTWGEIEPLQDTGFILKKKIRAHDEREARRIFVEWCHTQNLHAPIETVCLARLKANRTSCENARKER